MNIAIIMGRLGKDPEVRSTPGGTAVTEFSVATSRVWYDKQDQKQEETTWHTVVAWGKQAETVGKYFAKGDGIMVEGRITVETWEDKQSGEKKWRNKIVMARFEFPPGKGKASSESSSNEDPYRDEDYDIPF